MEKTKLDQLRALLPHRYAKTLQSMIADPEIDDTTVQRVFNGSITNAETVQKVVEKALELIESKKTLESKIDSVISN